MTRIDDDTVVHLLKSSVGDPPHPPDRYERILAEAGAQRHRRGLQSLGTLCLVLAIVGSVVALDRRGTVLGDPVTVLTAAAGKAEDLGTARIEGTAEFSAAGIASSVSISGEIDFRTDATSLTMVTEVNGKSTPTQRTIVVDGDLYTSIPDGAGTALTAGKRWIRTEGSSQLGAFSGAGADPRATLATLKRISKDVRSLGRETIRGVRTTRYRFRTSGSDDQSESGVLGAVPDVVSEVWIDDDNLPRRFRLKLDVSKQMAAVRPSQAPVGDATSVVTFDFFDYGKPVSIEAPPADQVLDADDPLAAGAGGSACVQTKQRELNARIQADVKAGRILNFDQFFEEVQQLIKDCELGAQK